MRVEHFKNKKWTPVAEGGHPGLERSDIQGLGPNQGLAPVQAGL